CRARVGGVPWTVCSSTPPTTQPARMSGGAPASQSGAVSRRKGEGRCDQGSRAMTTPSGPEPGQPDPGLPAPGLADPGLADPGLAAIMSERRQLINVAYRLLGSLAEAEDVVPGNEPRLDA